MPHTHDSGNAGELANELFTSLTTDVTVPEAPDFSDPKFDFEADTSSPLYADVTALSVEDVTCSTVDGDGAFDRMMKAVNAHLEQEFKNNRITGDQYAKVYAEVMGGVLSNATQFVLTKDQAKWQAITAQMQGRIAEINATGALVELEKIKAETAKSVFEMQNSGATYALTKMKLATEEAQHCSLRSENALKSYELQHVLPAEVAIQHFRRKVLLPSEAAINQVQSDRILPAQAVNQEFTNRVLQPLEEAIQRIQAERIMPTQAEVEEFNLNSMLPVKLAQEQHQLNHQMPAQTNLVKEQIETTRANTLDTRVDNLTPIGGTIGLAKEAQQKDIDTKDYVLNNQLPKQVELLGKQIDLTDEQTEAERAKTLDTRSDGATVEGSVGKQKDLYDQQIDSFIKDAKHKTAKMYLDGWITQKTLDEGLTAPNELTNTNVDSVLSSIRSTNNL